LVDHTVYALRARERHSAAGSGLADQASGRAQSSHLRKSARFAVRISRRKAVGCGLRADQADAAKGTGRSDGGNRSNQRRRKAGAGASRKTSRAAERLPTLQCTIPEGHEVLRRVRKGHGMKSLLILLAATMCAFGAIEGTVLNATTGKPQAG